MALGRARHIQGSRETAERSTRCCDVGDIVHPIHPGFLSLSHSGASGLVKIRREGATGAALASGGGRPWTRLLGCTYDIRNLRTLTSLSNDAIRA